MNSTCSYPTVVMLIFLALLNTAAHAETPSAAWQNGPPNDPTYIPIGIWAQNSAYAEAYQDLGVNLYVHLHGGPTEAQLAPLHEAGMQAIARQNDYARSLLDEQSPLLETIVAWMHRDEPDNAQPAAEGGYGPPVPPERIQQLAEQWREVDPTRPIYLNLGWGVGWDGWHGRGVRTNHPEDYPQYTKGSDIVSFDIYPANMRQHAVHGELWRIAYGTQRLRDWTAEYKPVWSIIEARSGVSPTQLRAQVWMSIIHGATGIVWFVHEFDSGGLVTDRAILDHDELRPVFRELNQQLHDFAAVIHAPTVNDRLTTELIHGDSDDQILQEYGVAPVGAMLKEHDNALYLFAVHMRGGEARARFAIADLAGTHEAEALGEGRTVIFRDGQLDEGFEAWDSAIYRIPLD